MTNERRKEERRGKSPAYQHYAKDWIVDTARMTLEQEGAYIRLLSHQWIEGPLPNDRGELARILGIGKRKFASLWRTLCTHFPAHTEDTVANGRLEQEREKQAQFRAKMAEAGYRSAERRRNVGSTDVEPKGQPQSNPDPTLLSPISYLKSKTKETNTKPTNPDDEPIFDEHGNSAILSAMASEYWPKTRGKRS